MAKTSCHGMEAHRDDYKQGQWHQRSWRGVTGERMTEEVPKSGIENSDTLEGMLR